MKEILKRFEKTKGKIKKAGTAAAIVGGTIFLSGCTQENVTELDTAYTPDPTPARTEITPIPSSLEVDWQNLSPYQRIQRLETQQYPEYNEFNAMRELVIAVSELFYSSTESNMEPEEMAQNIFFVDTDQFTQEYEELLGRSLNTKETDVVKHQLEIENKKGQILINMKALSENVEEIKKEDQNLVKPLGNHNLFTVFTKSLLLRQFAYMNRSKEDIQLGKIIVSTQKNGDIYFTKLTGLVFIGEKQDGKVYSSDNASQALTEAVATLAGKESGHYIPSNKSNTDAVRIIENLNSRAKITRSEFLKAYFNKNSSIKNLLSRWATAINPKNKSGEAGYKILAAIGLYASEDMTKDEAESKIETY